MSQVRVRHDYDDGPGYVFGEWPFDKLDEAVRTLKREGFYLDGCDYGGNNVPFTTQFVFEDGGAYYEIAIGTEEG